MSMLVRPMRPEDMEQVMQLLAQWNIAPLAPSADIPCPERVGVIVDNTVVAEEMGRIIGVRSFIQHTPTEAEGASLAVDRDYHGRGIGRKLMLAGYRMMYERGIRKVHAETDRTEVVDWLSRKFGHKVVGTTRKRHAFGREDVAYWTVLEMDLDKYLIESLNEE